MSNAEVELFKNQLSQGNNIYGIGRQIDYTNQDFVGKKFTQNDNCNMALSDNDRMKAWAEHYSKLLNVEVDWSSDLLPAAALFVGPRHLLMHKRS